jgi:hypothetical protein
MADDQEETYTIEDVTKAIDEGNVRSLYDILQNSNIDLNYSSEDGGDTPLIRAICTYHVTMKSNNLFVIKVLLKFGADPNFKNKCSNMSPLYATQHLKEITLLLLDYGADPSGGCYGKSYLWFFGPFQYKNHELAIALMKAGAKKEDLYTNDRALEIYHINKEEVEKFFEECEYYDSILNSSRIKGAKK